MSVWSWFRISTKASAAGEEDKGSARNAHLVMLNENGEPIPLSRTLCGRNETRLPMFPDDRGTSAQCWLCEKQRKQRHDITVR